MKTPPPRLLPHPRGFTLIELLTVIAIIGILAAIIVPVVGKVRATATKATCASNLRQLATASQTFAQDNKGVFPTRDLGSGKGHWHDWKQPHVYSQANLELFLPYLSAAAALSDKREAIALLYCPGPLKNFIGPDTNNANYSGTGLYITYSYYNLRQINPAVLADYGVTDSKDLRRADRIPARYPLWSCLTFDKNGAFTGHAEPNVVGGGFSGQNMARADGSVHWVKGDELIPFISDGTNVFYSAKP
jgi:prepilin-type N-terminal cleavage/methylation domain-containing protein